MAVLDSNPYLAWLLIQLGIYWEQRSEEGRGMQVSLQRLLTMPMLYVLPYDGEETRPILPFPLDFF